METTTELKGCPFCGSGAKIQPCETEVRNEVFYTVECTSCSLEFGWYMKETDAIKKWNQRTD